MSKFKVIIAGTRTFNDYKLLKEKVDYLLKEKKKNHEIIIVSGGATGADSLGEKYALENNYNVIRMEAEWDKYGKAAGPIRNRNMAEIADACIVFWDRKSKGALNMIHEADKKGIKVQTYWY